MFPYQVARNTISFTKILGGLSKSLTIANQVIPIYKQAMPLIKNAKTAFSYLKNLNLSKNTTTNQNNTPQKININQTIQPETPTTSPTFFT